MEHTIDGIDYIAKSEVLRLIDEEVEEASRFANDRGFSAEYRLGMNCRILALRDLSVLIVGCEER